MKPVIELHRLCSGPDTYVPHAAAKKPETFAHMDETPEEMEAHIPARNPTTEVQTLRRKPLARDTCAEMKPVTADQTEEASDAVARHKPDRKLTVTCHALTTQARPALK